MKKILFKSFLIYGLGTGLSQSLQILLVPLYAKYFSTEDYGAMETIFSGFLLLIILGMLQIESAVGRYYFEFDKYGGRKANISTGFWTIAFTTIIFAVLGVIASSSLSAWFFGTEKYELAITLAFGMLPFACVFNYFAVLIRFANKPIIYVIATLTQIVLTIALCLFLVIQKGFGIEAVFIGQLSGYLLGMILYFFFFKKDITFNFSKSVLKRYFSFSLPIVPAVLGSWGNNHANRFALLSLLSLSEVGLYMMAYKIASVFKLLEIAFRMAWQPFFIEQYKKENHVAEFKKIAVFVTVIMSILVLLSFLLAKPITILLTSPKYYSAYDMVGWLSLAFALIIVSSVLNIGPILSKKTIYNTYSYFISIIVNFSFLFYLIPRMGVKGAAISLAMGNLALLLVSWYFSENLYPVFRKRK